MEIRCSRCGKVIFQDHTAADAVVRCGNCGALLATPRVQQGGPDPSELVIDVQAEPIGHEPDVRGEPVYDDAAPRVRPRYVFLERRVLVRDPAGGGCCGCGCLLLLLFLILWLVGCAAVVHG